MGLNFSTNLPMYVCHRPLEEYIVSVGIRAAHTSFSPFTLGLPSMGVSTPRRSGWMT